MGATLGPAIVGEFLRHVLQRNFAFFSSGITDTTSIDHIPLQDMMGMVTGHSMIMAMKEIYGWLLIISIASFLLIFISFTPIRPNAFFPKWRTVRTERK